MEDQNPAEAGKTEKRGRAKKWVFLGVGLLLLLGAAGSAFYFLGFGAEADELEENGQGPRSPNEVNEVLELEPLVVNLADESEIRYARIGISLGLANANPGSALLDERLTIPKLRDHCLVVFGEKTGEQLRTSEMKDVIKKDLADFINRELNPQQGKVVEVYFTEFIIQ